MTHEFLQQLFQGLLVRDIEEQLEGDIWIKPAITDWFHNVNGGSSERAFLITMLLEMLGFYSKCGRFFVRSIFRPIRISNPIHATS